MHGFYRELGRRIRAARQKLPEKVTQAILAQRVGVSRSSIANIEQGRQQPPVHLLVLLAEALKVPLQKLLPPIGEKGRDRTELVRALQRAQVDPDAIAHVTELTEREEGDIDANNES